MMKATGIIIIVISALLILNNTFNIETSMQIKKISELGSILLIPGILVLCFGVISKQLKQFIELFKRANPYAEDMSRRKDF